jgi:ribosome maturation factor RimP
VLPDPTAPVSLDDRVRALAEDAAADGSLYVVDVAVRGRPGGRVVEVFVESESGAGSDDLVAMSRRLGFVLDAEDVISGAYRLDVSTPGAERPLTDPRQFKRHVGKTLAVRYATGDADEQSATAVLTAADAETLTLGDGDDAVTLPYAAVREARVQLPW